MDILKFLLILWLTMLGLCFCEVWTDMVKSYVDFLSFDARIIMFWFWVFGGVAVLAVVAPLLGEHVSTMDFSWYIGQKEALESAVYSYILKLFLILWLTMLALCIKDVWTDMLKSYVDSMSLDARIIMFWFWVFGGEPVKVAEVSGAIVVSWDKSV